MRDVFFFDRMITPNIITFIYWVLLVIIALSGIGYLFAGAGGFFLRFLGAIATVVFGAIGVRIWCELLIVLFKMNEALQDIRKK